MNRIPRTAGTLVLTAALITTAVPAAQARVLAKPQAPSVSGSLLDAALAWLGNLGAPAASRADGNKSTTILPPPPEPIARPMGCSTIDPNGTTVCHGGGL
jgi:hypothetical protein